MENESCELGTGEPKNHLDMLPIKKGTDHPVSYTHLTLPTS
mgnify:CR=1 FL=1